MKDTAAVRASGLVKEFGDLRAVDGIDLEVSQGEILGVLGPNGAGKTTMAARRRPSAASSACERSPRQGLPASAVPEQGQGDGHGASLRTVLVLNCPS